MPEYSDWKISDNKCRCCGGQVRRRTVTSSCGGYDDEEYNCTECGYTWWIDGSDA